MEMKKRIAVAVAFLIFLAYSLPARAVDLGDILKGGAVIVGGGAAVTAIAGPLNDFINTVTFNRGVKADGYTKVVPILSVGNGKYMGAAQITAPTQSAVDRTKAVGQLETDYKSIRVKILVPIDSTNPLQQFKRVQGVGVTAVIDVNF